MPPAKKKGKKAADKSTNKRGSSATSRPNAARAALPAAMAQFHARGGAGTSSEGQATQQVPRRRGRFHVQDDMDDDAAGAEWSAMDGDDGGGDGAADPAELTEEDDGEEEEDDDDAAQVRPSNEESDDDNATEIDNKKLYMLMMKQQSAFTRLLNNVSQQGGMRVNALPPSAQAAAAAATFGAAAVAAAATAPSGSLTTYQPTALPLDGSTRKFGTGFRSKVVEAYATQWFRRVGAIGLLLPSNVAMPIAMEACGLDPNDMQQRGQFRMLFKHELSCTGSKTKQLMSNMFFDSLLILNRIPAIVDAGAAAPPLMELHRPVFKQLREPPAGFDASDDRYKYMSSWHAKLAASGELKAFEVPECARP